MTSFLGELNTMQIQSNKSAYECRICDNEFSSPFQLTVHCIVTHGLKPCIECLKLFECEQLLCDHKRINHANDKHTCAECSNEFPDESNFLSHMSLVHSKKFCTLCDQLISIDGQQQHNSIMHKTVKALNIRLPSFTVPDKENEFPCHLCNDNKSVDRLDKLFSHYLYFHKCSLKSILRCIVNNNALISHHFDGNANGKCCGLSENRKRSQNSPEQRSYEKRKKVNIAEISIDGEENIKYFNSFDTHLVKYVYSSASDYDSSDSEDGDRPRTTCSYQCDLCDFRSKLKFVYAMHMHKRHGFMIKTPEFRCNVCMKKFASNRNLRKHNQNSHHKRKSEKRFGCSFCNFRCNAKGKMR